MPRAPRDELTDLRARAATTEGVGVIDFPTAGQQTNDYEEFRDRVRQVPTLELAYLGLVVHGPRRAVNKLTGNLPLLGGPTM